MSNPQPSVAVPVELLRSLAANSLVASSYAVCDERADLSDAMFKDAKEAQALLSAPPGPAEKLWCAMCGKWGDHGSGSCPELRLSARVRGLEAAIREHRDACNTAATVAQEDQAHDLLWAALE